MIGDEDSPDALPTCSPISLAFSRLHCLQFLARDHHGDDRPVLLVVVLPVDDDRLVADPPGRVAIAAHAGLAARRHRIELRMALHVQRSGHVPDSVQGRIKVRDDLVDSHHDDDLAGSEQHRRRAVAVPIDVDDPAVHGQCVRAGHEYI